MRTTPLLLVVALTLSTGCATRATASFTHGPIGDRQLLNDKQRLEDVDGVDQVLVRHASDGTATMIMTAEQDELDEAIAEAQELGWTKVRQ